MSHSAPGLKPSFKNGTTFLRFQDRFPTEESCLNRLHQIKWKNGFQCSECGYLMAVFRIEQKTLQCNRCKKAYALTAGTLFYETHLSLRKWFLCIFLILTFGRRISIRELQRQLEIGSFQAVWRMSYKIRDALREKHQREFLENLILSGTARVTQGVAPQNVQETPLPIVTATSETPSVGSRPDIFNYGNYREFLRDLSGFLKRETRYFSFRYFAKQAGFKSINFLKLVIDGKRNLTEESAKKVAKGFRLNLPEARAFEALVKYDKSTSSEDREKFLQMMAQYRAKRDQIELSQAQFSYLSRWYYVAIRELMNLKEFREDYEWIAQKISPAISAAEAREAVDHLLRLGIAKRMDGRLVLVEGIINVASIAGEQPSSLLAKFHREMIKKGSEAIDRYPRQERQVLSATLGISEQGFAEIKEMVEEFQLKALSISDNDQEKKNRLYQLNVQLFPVSVKMS